VTLFEADIERGATLSECGSYRYALWRFWDHSKPVVCWCMLNPSTADASVDDPTIRRCMGFARGWGYGGIRVVNLFALRATNPAKLAGHPHPVSEPGPYAFWENLNDAHIIQQSDGSHLIAAWGTYGGLSQRDRAVMRLLANRRVECLGITKNGFPIHPLYVAGDARPLVYTGSD